VFADRELMEEFLTWLRDRHVADVCAAGAVSADLVRLDPTSDLPNALEVRYRFASREAFELYEREHAPRLRAEGLAEIVRLGGVADRVTFVRTIGELVDWRKP
jgi:hypothetical protein